jgi:hypothetical protein
MDFFSYVREIAFAVVITLKVTDQVAWSWVLIFGIYTVAFFLIGFLRGAIRGWKKQNENNL